MLIILAFLLSEQIHIRNALWIQLKGKSYIIWPFKIHKEVYISNVLENRRSELKLMGEGKLDEAGVVCLGYPQDLAAASVESPYSLGTGASR